MKEMIDTLLVREGDLLVQCTGGVPVLTTAVLAVPSMTGTRVQMLTKGVGAQIMAVAVRNTVELGAPVMTDTEGNNNNTWLVNNCLCYGSLLYSKFLCFVCVAGLLYTEEEVEDVGLLNVSLLVVVFSTLVAMLYYMWL